MCDHVLFFLSSINPSPFLAIYGSFDHSNRKGTLSENCCIQRKIMTNWFHVTDGSISKTLLGSQHRSLLLIYMYSRRMKFIIGMQLFRHVIITMQTK